MEKISTENIEKVIDIYDKTIDTLNGVLIGQDNVKKVVASAILCDTRSRMLLTGIPGMGKTTLANFLASNFETLKIYVTADLLPSEVQEQLKNHQKMHLLQIEEFNRASGKVLAAFNEVFEEHRLTLNGTSYSFDDFYVLATQNNVDISGIFNIPFAVLDRFDVNIAFDPLTYEEKRQLLFGEKLYTDRRINKDDINFTKGMVGSLELTKKSIDLFMAMTDMIDALTYNNKKLFAGSNIRAHSFALKIAKFNALADGRTVIKPRDFAGFINYLYLHRIDQRVLKMEDDNTQNIFYDVSQRILELK